MGQDFKDDVHLFNLRTMNPGVKGAAIDVAMLVQRRGFECGLVSADGPEPNTGGELLLSSIFARHSISSAQEHSLTLLHKAPGGDLGPTGKLLMAPMEIYTVRLALQPS